VSRHNSFLDIKMINNSSKMPELMLLEHNPFGRKGLEKGPETALWNFSLLLTPTTHLKKRDFYNQERCCAYTLSTRFSRSETQSYLP